MVSVGYCQCGCGEKAPSAKQTVKKLGWVRGEPLRFIVGHNHRGLFGPLSPGWKGGTSKTGRYLLIQKKDHPKADKRGYILEHILSAEKVLGKQLPERAVIHHHTEKQLIICQNQNYHMLLHMRTNALNSCGHADWRKCALCHKYDQSSNLYMHETWAVHRKCRRRDQRERYKNSK